MNTKYNDYLHEIVFRYKEFGYNSSNVCVTPHTLVNWCHGDIFFKIETALSPNEKWDSALQYSIGGSGCGRMCSLLTKNDPGYKTEKEGIYHELIWLEQKINSELEKSAIAMQHQDTEDEYPISKNMIPNLRLALKQVAVFKEQFNPSELNLFD